ncbi:PH domain-containing protein [Halorientalis salina]|uniref:PH domain-containing protein n=1 Tax=Halorientalis salina TaxID=2932266 RepID=UPI0010ACBDCE|nr:PH domain-containing protein [Halorientalis salina]
MTAKQVDTAEVANGNESDEEVTELVRTHPTVKPTLIRLGVVLVVGLAVFGLLQASPGLLGSPDITSTAALVVVLLTLVLTVRFVVRTIILRRTTYLVTTDRVEQRYELLFRVHSKGVRFDKLRSHELTQNRVQSLLGFGTISLNRGLGPIRLENVDDPESVYRTIQQCSRGAE